MTLYDDLGVEQDSTLDTIKKAWRKKAREAHPDKGGEKEDFQVIQHAYTVLSDESKRKRYDETGDHDDQPDDAARMHEVLIGMFASLVDSAPTVENHDIIRALRICIYAMNEEQRLAILTTEKRLKKYAGARKRVIRTDNGDGRNIFADALEVKINDLNRQIAAATEQVEFNLKMLAFVRTYGYQCGELKES